MWISWPWKPSEQSSLRKCPSLKLTRSPFISEVTKLSLEALDLWLRLAEPEDLRRARPGWESGRGLAERPLEVLE